MRQFWQKFSEKLSFMLKFMKPLQILGSCPNTLRKGKKRVM